MAPPYHSIHSSWKVMMPVMVPVAAWLLVSSVILLLSYLAARKRRKRLLHNVPTLFFWVHPRSRLASWLRRPWNPQTFDELVAREFEERDHPPVLAIIGPLPWFAPTVLTNDAAVITELVRRSNRRIQTPRLIPRSNSSGNLLLFHNTAGAGAGAGGGAAGGGMNPNLNLSLNVNMTVGGSVNPHNRHLHQAWAPQSCVEEYHHLVFATATSAVKDVLRKWDRKLQEKRAALARRRQSTATVAVVAVAAAAAAAAAAAVAVGQGQSQGPGSQGQRPRGRSTGSMEELGGKGRPRGRSAGSLDEAKQPGEPPRASEAADKDLEAAGVDVEEEDEEEESDYDEEEGMGMELASGAIKVNVWKQGRKLAKRMHEHLFATLTKPPPPPNPRGPFSRSKSDGSATAITTGNANGNSTNDNGTTNSSSSQSCRDGLVVTRMHSFNDLTAALEAGQLPLPSPNSTVTSTASASFGARPARGRGSGGGGSGKGGWLKRLGERLAMWWAAVAGAVGAVAVRIKRRASSVLGKEEPPQDDGRLADILLLLRNDEVVGTAALGPVIVPSHMPDAAAPSSPPTSPTAGAAASASPPTGGGSGTSTSTSGMGGNESCAHALSVLMMVLAHYPKYQDLIYDEACRVLGRGKKTASLLLLSSQGQLTGLQDVQRLPYARGVMNEVFRLYPPDKDLVRTTPGQLTVALPPTAMMEAMDKQRQKQAKKAARLARRQQQPQPRALPTALTPKGGVGGGGTTPRGSSGGGYTPRGGGANYHPSPRNSSSNGGGGNYTRSSPRASSSSSSSVGFEPSAGVGVLKSEPSGLGAMPSTRPRLAPIPSFSACALEASLPQGTALTLSLFALHRHPALYENPHAFQPERWIARHKANSWRHEPTALSFDGDAQRPGSLDRRGSSGGGTGSGSGRGLGGRGGSLDGSAGSAGGAVSGWAAMLVEYEEDGSVAFPQQMMQLQVLTALLMLLQKYRIERVGHHKAGGGSGKSMGKGWGRGRRLGGAAAEEDDEDEDEEDIDAIIRKKITNRTERKKVRLVPRVPIKD